MALEQTGLPADELVPDWEAIELELTSRLMLLYRAHHEAKMEVAQIFLGRTRRAA